MRYDKEGHPIIDNLNEIDPYLKKRNQDNKDRLYSYKNGQITVDHVAATNAIVKFIQATPMDGWIKKIMIMRLGSPLMKQKAMSHLQIALSLGMLENEVLELEKIGIKIVEDYMNKITIQDGVDKSNSDDNNKLIKDTFNMVNSSKEDRQEKE